VEGKDEVEQYVPVETCFEEQTSKKEESKEENDERTVIDLDDESTIRDFEGTMKLAK